MICMWWSKLSNPQRKIRYVNRNGEVLAVLTGKINSESQAICYSIEGKYSIVSLSRLELFKEEPSRRLVSQLNKVLRQLDEL